MTEQSDRGSDQQQEHVVPIDPDLPLQPLARLDPRAVVAVALGGALGAPARYGISQLVPTAKDAFPWATFWTNVSGAFALGFILIWLIDRYPPSTYLRPFLATGFLGAYTTFSTFAVDADLLVKDGRPGLAVLYVIASLTAGLLAVWAGIGLGRTLGPRSAR